MEVISDSKRKARKNHNCDLCGGIINNGEMYDCQFNKNCGDVYSFKSHEKCSSIMDFTFEFADHTEGYNSDDFHDCCQEICNTFVCPNCSNYDHENNECKIDECFCLDKVYKLSKNYNLIQDGMRDWELEPFTLKGDLEND